MYRGSLTHTIRNKGKKAKNSHHEFTFSVALFTWTQTTGPNQLMHMKRYNLIFQMRGPASLDLELKPFYSSFSTGFLVQKHNIHQRICNISSLEFLCVMQSVEC